MRPWSQPTGDLKASKTLPFLSPIFAAKGSAICDWKSNFFFLIIKFTLILHVGLCFSFSFFGAYYGWTLKAWQPLYLSMSACSCFVRILYGLNLLYLTNLASKNVFIFIYLLLYEQEQYTCAMAWIGSSLSRVSSSLMSVFGSFAYIELLDRVIHSHKIFIPMS